MKKIRLDQIEFDQIIPRDHGWFADMAVARVDGVDRFVKSYSGRSSNDQVTHSMFV